jgi:hypothetical protein
VETAQLSAIAKPVASFLHYKSAGAIPAYKNRLLAMIFINMAYFSVPKVDGGRNTDLAIAQF